MRYLSFYALMLTAIFLTASPDAYLNEILNTIEEEICEGDSLTTPEGTKYFETGTYIDTFQRSNLCDSIRTLILTVNEKGLDIIINASFCEGDPEIPTELILPGTNCEGDTTLNLTIIEKPDPIITNVTICEGESFESDTIPGALCEPDQILNVTILPRTPDTIFEALICLGDTYIWPYNNEAYDQAGSYIQIESDANGCPYDVILFLSIASTSGQTEEVDIQICEGQSYEGYNETGRYAITKGDQAACFDTTYLNLTVVEVGGTIETIINETICNGTTFCYKEIELTEPGVYFLDTLQSQSGCDSILILNLELYEQTPDEFMIDCISSFPDPPFPLPGTYTIEMIDENGCSYNQILELLEGTMDSTLQITICEGEEYRGYSETGNYQVEETDEDGCTYTVFLILEVIPIEDCDVATENLRSPLEVNIFPNPTLEQFSLTRKENTDPIHIEILNFQGNSILKQQLNTTINHFDISQHDSGTYILKITDAKTQKYVTKKLIKL